MRNDTWSVYVKLWTAIFEDDWFMSLRLNERGAFLLLIVYAKMVGDTGRISLGKIRDFSGILNCDEKTSRKILGKFHEKSKIVLEEGSNSVTVTIPNYHYWQHDRKAGRGKSAGKIPEKSPLKGKERTGSNKGQADSVISLFNKLCPSLPKVQRITATRIKAVVSRHEDNPNFDWESFFSRIEASDFLAGRKTDFHATFDWIFKLANFTKIIEGNYYKRTTPKKQQKESPFEPAR